MQNIDKMIKTIKAHDRACNYYTDISPISDKVLNALKSIPREYFVPKELISQSYNDNPLPIGSGQTISQPFIVALMTHLLDIQPSDNILEIGTGSGYQTAILSMLANHVYSLEIVPKLAQMAINKLGTIPEVDTKKITIKSQTGQTPWGNDIKFDKIIVACTANNVPKVLVSQLKEKGKLVIPTGKNDFDQVLKLVEKINGKIIEQDILDVRFVPFID